MRGHIYKNIDIPITVFLAFSYSLHLLLMDYPQRLLYSFQHILVCFSRVRLKILHSVFDVLLDISILRLVVYLRVNSFLDGFYLFVSATQELLHQLLLHFVGYSFPELLHPLAVYLHAKVSMVGAVPLPEGIDVVVKELVQLVETHLQIPFGLQVSLLGEILSLEQ